MPLPSRTAEEEVARKKRRAQHAAEKRAEKVACLQHALVDGNAMEKSDALAAIKETKTNARIRKRESQKARHLKYGRSLTKRNFACNPSFIEAAGICCQRFGRLSRGAKKSARDIRLGKTSGFGCRPVRAVPRPLINLRDSNDKVTVNMIPGSSVDK